MNNKHVGTELSHKNALSRSFCRTEKKLSRSNPLSLEGLSDNRRLVDKGSCGLVACGIGYILSPLNDVSLTAKPTAYRVNNAREKLLCMLSVNFAPHSAGRKTNGTILCNGG